MKVSKTTLSVFAIVFLILLTAITVACSQFGCSNNTTINTGNETDWKKECTKSPWTVKENYTVQDNSIAEYIINLNTLTFINNNEQFSVIIDKDTDTQVGPLAFSFTDNQNGILTTIFKGSEVKLSTHFSKQNEEKLLTLETPMHNKMYLTNQ